MLNSNLQKIEASPVHTSFKPGKVKSLANFTAMDEIDELAKIGFGLDSATAEKMAADMGQQAMDSLQSPTFTGNLGIPVQFLQAWLPGAVMVVTAAMKIDDILGLQTVGDFADDQVIQMSLEMTGKPQPYGDFNNVPLASFNPNYEARTIVRFEEGLQVGYLEGLRYNKVNIDTAATKRKASMLALNIIRNQLGFFGYNSGIGKTYGFLNDPNLSAYVTVANGATSGSPLWSTKTYTDIQNDLRVAMATLEGKMQGLLDTDTDAIMLVLPVLANAYLSVTSIYGNSVREWLKETYPGLIIKTAPELNAANGGANVFYLFALNAKGDSTDDGATWAQMVPARFQMIGTERRIKTYVEDYGNASAGVLLKRPFAVVRYTGI